MPTIKQKLAFREVVEKGRSVSGAMRDVGYSPNTAIDPSKLTKSDGWQELMEKHLPDRLLAKKHKEGLDASRKIIVEGTEVAQEPDYAVRHKYLDSAYKLKGKYVTNESQQNTLIINITGEASERYGRTQTNTIPVESSS